MVRPKPQPIIRGEAHLVSAWFSNEWRLLDNGNEVARMRRFPRLHVSVVRLADGTEWTIEPDGFAVVKAIDSDGVEVGRITRRSWWGRRWDITGTGFAYELTSHPIPRRWTIGIGGSPMTEIKGSLISYNTVTIDAPLSLATVAGVLAWHVIARPWEAAAAPRGLVPRGRVPGGNAEDMGTVAAQVHVRHP
ncbi:MAG: hypothetical protein OEP52_03095 [Acidimicrobiia bacterium]|nr:hypothetical protein [Acidimicrobiia bacterium]